MSSSKNSSSKPKPSKKKSKQFDYTFKIVMIGDSGVGKSCILLLSPMINLMKVFMQQ